MKISISAGSVTSPKGFRASGIRCGLKQQGRDMALVLSDQPAHVAAMFTTNKVPAHCITYNKNLMTQTAVCGVIVNAGNANCCTGEQGAQDAAEMSERTAELLALQDKAVFNLSTGVIGEFMPMNKIHSGIESAVQELSVDGGIDAAHAIMTTDTVPKHFSTTFKIGEKECTIGVIAKGAGMINPNLATMFCIFTTDVAISQPLLQQALKNVVGETINRLTVDGEMSTNDCVLLFANGAAENELIDAQDQYYQVFENALKELATAATKALAADGEGATTCVTVTVTQANTLEEAVDAAEKIANSVLVKTAIFGKDPNWGRVVQSTGASSAAVNLSDFYVKFAGVTVAENGGAIYFDEKKMQEKLNEKDIHVEMGLGSGNASATVFTCDLTYDYVTINAEYHT